MVRVEQRRWVRVRDGTWAMADGPSVKKAPAEPHLSDILEAVELTEASTTWTGDEHERFVQGLRMFPHGPYQWITEHIQTKSVSEVKSYGMLCWQSEEYQQLIAIRQKREQAARTRSCDRSTTAKHPALGKWLRSTLRWCVHALSFRCLRRRSGCTHLAEEEDPEGVKPISSGYDQEPTQDYKTEIISRDSSDAATATASTMNRGASVEETLRRDGLKTSVEKRGQRLANKLPILFVWELQRLLLARTKEPCGTASVRHVLTSYGYERSAPPNVLYDSQDKVEIQSARQDALSANLGHAKQQPALQAAPTADTEMKNGPWSSDEHDRYCEALGRFRYGSWKLIADHVGTRTERQIMSHAQSIRAKRKRTEEREQNGQYGPAPSKPRVLRHVAAAPKGRSEAPLNTPSIPTTPGELQRTTHPVALAASGAFEQSDSLAATMVNGSNVLRVSTDASTSGLAANGGGEQIPSAFLASTSTDNDKGCLPVLPTRDSSFPHYVDAGLHLQDEVPLCSPPHNILRGSFLSDEDLFQLLDDPQIQLKRT